MSSNCHENSSADLLLSNWTRIFVVNCNVRTCRHNIEYFRQALILSSGVDREIAGNVCLNLLRAISIYSRMIESFQANLVTINPELQAILYTPSCIHPKQ
ncbi:hypothetical protein TNCT_466631 [Trichonephila clavata]|uniref:Uncharacterized protein n=1 Tax=Trichonephila clavata TaxID=2740835 RepID=A0A8X6I6H2_TRICU|nr:hypothetical protein TNCT_466631 [Trichonephila clavata]